MIKTETLHTVMAHVEHLPSNELLQWSLTATDDEVTVALAGELDMSNAETLRRLLDSVVDAQPVTVNVDLANLSFLDSSGIQCLVDAAQAASSVGCHVVVRNPSDIIVRVLMICGVDKVLLADSGGDESAGSFAS
jgi:anti-sigma B factor antagonist